MKRSVKVFVRVRPSKKATDRLQIPNENTIIIKADQSDRLDRLSRVRNRQPRASTPTSSSRSRARDRATSHGATPKPKQHIDSPRSITKDTTYIFERIFAMPTLNEEVYQHVAVPMINSLFKGYNSCILAFGQSGSGKTYTMTGSHLITGDTKDRGIIVRVIQNIMEQVKNRKQDGWTGHVSMSNVQVYLETITDLFAQPKKHGGSDNHSNDGLRIRESRLGDGVYVENAIRHPILDYKDGIKWVNYGSKNRVVSKTDMNSVSSRSHSILMIYLVQENTNNGKKLESVMYLVDLAGSERVAFTHAEGVELKQASAVNKSLSTLTNVINAITNKTVKHIPYRDSKLTRILQNTLGGNCLSSMIITVSPEEHYLTETLSSLRFGARAINMPNKPKVNTLMSLSDYRKLLEKAQKKITEQRIMIKTLKQQLNVDAISIASSTHSLDQLLSEQIKTPIQSPRAESKEQVDTSKPQKNRTESKFKQTYARSDTTESTSTSTSLSTPTMETKSVTQKSSILNQDTSNQDNTHLELDIPPKKNNEEDDDDAILDTIYQEVHTLEEKLLQKVQIIHDLQEEVTQLKRRIQQQAISQRQTQTQTQYPKQRNTSDINTNDVQENSHADINDERLIADNLGTSQTVNIVMLTLGVVLIVSIYCMIAFLPSTSSVFSSRIWLSVFAFWIMVAGALIGLSI